MSAPSHARPARPTPLVLVVALALACASSKQQQTATPSPTFRDTRTETATAVVQAVDLQTREVTLKAEDGREFGFTAGEDVRNLDQLQVGDTVKVTYTESLAIDLKRADGSAPAVSESSEATRAGAGQKPGGTASRTVTVTAEITDIDRASSRVTLRGPKGNYRVVEVTDSKKLEDVKVGDMVRAMYTESIGIAVEKVPAPGK